MVGKLSSSFHLAHNVLLASYKFWFYLCRVVIFWGPILFFYFYVNHELILSSGSQFAILSPAIGLAGNLCSRENRKSTGWASWGLPC